VRLSKGNSGSQYYQRKVSITTKTSGYRRRYFMTSQKRYPGETTSDTGSEETTYSYTYHTGDALAAKKRTTTLPTVATADNGPGSAVSLYDYFEIDGLHTWSKDGEGHVHYRGFDPNLRVPTITVVDVDTDTADRPAGVPAPPETTFQSSTGLNIVNEMEYDALGRITKRIGPAFDAYNGSSVTSTKTTARWHYSKLSGDELVVLQYPHIDSSYFHAAVTMTVSDHDGNAITQCQGELSSAKRNTNLDEDLDETQSTIASAFAGTIIQRTDSEYIGGKVTKVEVWSDADNSARAREVPASFPRDDVPTRQIARAAAEAGPLVSVPHQTGGHRVHERVDDGGKNRLVILEREGVVGC